MLAGLGLYIFTVQILTINKPFLRLDLLKDRNYRSGLALTFFVGIILLATSALLPPYLQDLGGYSVMDTGLLLAPRGVGTMITMLFVGRIVMKVDPRKLMAFGATILIWSLWEMSRWTPDIDSVRRLRSRHSCRAWEWDLSSSPPISSHSPLCPSNCEPTARASSIWCAMWVPRSAYR